MWRARPEVAVELTDGRAVSHRSEVADTTRRNDEGQELEGLHGRIAHAKHEYVLVAPDRVIAGQAREVARSLEVAFAFGGDQPGIVLPQALKTATSGRRHMGGPFGPAHPAAPDGANDDPAVNHGYAV